MAYLNKLAQLYYVSKLAQLCRLNWLSQPPFHPLYYEPGPPTVSSTARGDGRGGVSVGVTRGVVCVSAVGVGPGSVWAFSAFRSE